jgi:cyclophilin family peptidyl-prolyl cis-trans isomerase
MKARFIVPALLLIGCLTASFNSARKNLVEIHTSYGDIVIYLYDATPKHKANFLKLAKEKYFNSTTFHRVIKNFVIQGGDPNSKDKDTTNDGDGGPAYTIEPEINPLIRHKYGAVGAARESDDINPKRESSGSQFYIVIRNGGTPHLDDKYTVFGEVVSGMDVAEKIASVPKNAKDRPLKDIPMKVKIIHHAKGFDEKKMQVK